MKTLPLGYDAVYFGRFLPPFLRIMRPSGLEWMDTAGVSETFALIRHTARPRIQEDSNTQYSVVFSYSCLSVSNYSCISPCSRWMHQVTELIFWDMAA
jgi:hypothetical protein